MGLQNILENPLVGMCFVIPGNPITLRIGGRATLRKDPELLRRLAARGIDATLAIHVDVTHTFFHCAKAYMRCAFLHSLKDYLCVLVCPHMPWTITKIYVLFTARGCGNQSHGLRRITRYLLPRTLRRIRRMSRRSPSWTHDPRRRTRWFRCVWGSYLSCKVG